MKPICSFLLLISISCRAHAQTTKDLQGPLVHNQPDGFPALPTFDLKDNYNAVELKNVKDEIKYGGFLERTDKPLTVDQIVHFPTLGSNAFEVLAQKAIHGTFALSSIQAAPSMRGIINFSFKRFENSLASRQMFYRHIDTNSDANSPLFSPNGQSILLHDGIVQDRFDAFGIYLWELNQGKLRYLPITLRFPHLFWSPGSRYISYVQGGDAFGDDDPDDPQKLCVLDTVTRRSLTVMAEPGLVWSWTYDGHLLCARVPREVGLTESARPSVYRVSAQGGTPEKLFDGGYYANQSPDGQDILFFDWSGKLIEDENASPHLKNNDLTGLFFWNAKTQIRTFLGSLPVNGMEIPRAAPQIIWSNDNRHAYVMVPGHVGPQIVGRVYVADIQEKTLRALGQVVFTPLGEMGWFEPRLQLSPDEKHLYMDGRETVKGDDGRNDLRYTLWQMDTGSGECGALARLTNKNLENPDWDFHDDSGLNPDLMDAQKRENAETKTLAAKMKTGDRWGFAPN